MNRSTSKTTPKLRITVSLWGSSVDYPHKGTMMRKCLICHVVITSKCLDIRWYLTGIILTQQWASLLLTSPAIPLFVQPCFFSGAHQRKHHSSAPLAFVRGIHRLPVQIGQKGQIRGKCFHLMASSWTLCTQESIFESSICQETFKFKQNFRNSNVTPATHFTIVV